MAHHAISDLLVLVNILLISKPPNRNNNTHIKLIPAFKAHKTKYPKTSIT